jgi:urea transport system substrate-binding protein
MESSQNIVYLGAVPNQQVLPALRYLRGFLPGKSKKWYLVGSDYVFPHAVNEVIKDEAASQDATIVGEGYVVLGSPDMTAIIKDIVSTKPDLILNTLNGDSNVAFFRCLRRAGIQSDKTPTLSFSVSESELRSLQIKEYAGDYVAGNYLEGQDSEKNRQFLKAFHDRYEAKRRVSDAMQTAYYGVHMWAQGVKKAGDVDPVAIRNGMKGLKFDAPQGHVEIDEVDLHCTQHVRIGQFLADGKTQEVFVTPQPVRAQPYPTSRPPAAWDAFLTKLYVGWGNRWSNAGQ